MINGATFEPPARDEYQAPNETGAMFIDFSHIIQIIKSMGASTDLHNKTGVAVILAAIDRYTKSVGVNLRSKYVGMERDSVVLYAETFAHMNYQMVCCPSGIDAERIVLIDQILHHKHERPDTKHFVLASAGIHFRILAEKLLDSGRQVHLISNQGAIGSRCADLVNLYPNSFRIVCLEDLLKSL